MKTKQLHRNGSLWTSPSNTLIKYTGLLCCVLELTAGAKLPSFPPSLRGTFHAHPGDQAHSYESISRSPCFNCCTTGIIKSRGNYGNIIPRINTTISPSTFFPHKQMKNREHVGLIASLVSITKPMDGRVQKSFNYVESFLALWHLLCASHRGSTCGWSASEFTVTEPGHHREPQPGFLEVHKMSWVCLH